MTTKEAIITFLTFLVAVPAAVYGWARLIVWLGCAR